jgi:predicted metalloendopeptidase
MSFTINNFFKDVNKNWLSKHQIPNNDTSISHFEIIENTISKDLTKIIHRERHNKNSFGIFLESFYTGRENDVNNLHLFAESLCNFTDYTGLMKSIGLLNLYNLNSPISLDFNFDSKNNSNYTIIFEEPDIGLEKADYEKNSEILNGYKQYLDTFGKQINFHELKTEFLEIETHISKILFDTQIDIDTEIMYNPMTFNNLCQQFNNIQFEVLFDACKIPKHIQKSKIYIITNIKYMIEINRLLASKNLDFWRIWIKACIYTSLHYILPGELRKTYFNFFYKQLLGQKHEIHIDDFCIDICKTYSGDILGKLYIESDLEKFKYIKTDITNIITNIKDVAKTRILKLTWLSESSRMIAIHKLDKMSLKVAYPDIWYDIFKGEKMDKSNFLLNLLLLLKRSTNDEIQKLTSYTNINKKMWDVPCYEVNAFYYSEMNEFCIPVGFLFPPFYDKTLSFVQIMAGIGNVIGHEISHGFDKDGRKFDENGNNFPWWTSLDLELYNIKTKQIVDLFNRQKYYGLKINGEMTLDENLADFGALAITLDVIHDSWKGKSISETEKKKQLQEFFIWYSRTWVLKTTRQKQKLAVKTNVHAPAELRVNTLVPHFADFYYAFDFNEHHEGFINPEDRVDIWGK